MRLSFFIIGSILATMIVGCYASIHIDKRPNVAVPIYKMDSNSVTNEVMNWIIVD